MDTLCKRLRYYRIKSNFTQAEVAEKLGMKVSNYQKYESGSRNPKECVLSTIADILNVPINHLKSSELEVEYLILNRYIKDSAMGDFSSLGMYFDDLHYEDNISNTMSEFFEHHKEMFEYEYPEFFEEYLSVPSLVKTIDLYSLYNKSTRSFARGNGELGVHKFANDDNLREWDYYKLAFCISAYDNFMASTIKSLLAETILYNAEKGFTTTISELPNITDDGMYDDLSDKELDELENATKCFAIMVFIPFLAFISETLEGINEQGTLEDFENYFLYGAVAE